MAGSILITGDIVLDENLYAGARLTPDSGERGTHLDNAPGGALITWSLLKKLAGTTPDPRHGGDILHADDLLFGLQETTTEEMAAWPEGFRARAVWEAKDTRWCLAKSLGYGATALPYPAKPVSNLNELNPRVVVIDDGMLGFRDRTASHCWPSLIAGGPEAAPGVEWIVLKMASPLGNGDLWHALTDKWKDRLILIVNAGDLRRADVRLARGLSWDQTAEDVLAELENHGPLRNLCGCRHLVVTLVSDGAVWLSKPGDPAQRRGQLVFDRGRAEGEFDEETGRLAPYGSLSAMTASIAWRLWYEGKTPNLIPALKAGLSAARVLRECGHGLATKGSPLPTFPLAEVVREIRSPIITLKEPDKSGKPSQDLARMELASHTYASVELPQRIPAPDADKDPKGRTAPWTILKANTEGAVVEKFWSKNENLPPLFGAARRLALFGPGSLSGVPFARFGKLLTMDRGDIESLRSIRQLMLRYKAEEKPKTPLSIAVFGAPGSGKSFGLKQIAESVFHDKALEFNLSQFKGPDELYGAYHQVRDKVLAGITPVVFWDEFDSRELMWLQYLLAPMQDGVFQEGPLTHSIGKCVFVFAGGTSYDYRHFGPPEAPAEKETEDQKKARREFILKKGPDFKSRLTTCLNVLGPNPRKLFSQELAAKEGDPWYDDHIDIEYPVRRAILLRGLLGCGGKDDENKRLRIDPGLLTALLEVGHYRNGARSLEKLLGQIVSEGSAMPSRAGLPHREILELLVQEVDDFYDRLYRTGLGGDAESLAEKIHERYLEQIKSLAVPNPESAKAWKDLAPDLKASNRAAAQRIAEILAAVGLTCEPGKASTDEAESAERILTANLDMLAEMEHDGWMDEKKRQGWTFGETRDNDRLKHPLLIPYGDLPEVEKEKDRDSIREYARRVADAGCKIVFKSAKSGATGASS
jgi:hypothetical protein